MRKLIFKYAFLGLAWLSINAQSKVVTAAADPYPPFIDPSSPTNGLAIEIINAALGTQGYSLTFQNIPWARSVTMVMNGIIDIIPDIWLNEERKKDFIFSEPYAANELKFIKVKGDPFEYTGIESLNDKVVGTVRGFNYGLLFQNATNFKKDEANDILSSVRKVAAKRVDLSLDDQIVISSLIKNSDPTLLDQIAFTKNALVVHNLYVAAGRKNPRASEIINAFNKGLAVIKANGVQAKILLGYGIK